MSARPHLRAAVFAALALASSAALPLGCGARGAGPGSVASRAPSSSASAAASAPTGSASAGTSEAVPPLTPAAPLTPGAPTAASLCADPAQSRTTRLHACAEACMAREATACLARAELASTEEGPVALRQAADFFDRACHFGAEAGCNRWRGLVDGQRAACSPIATDACLLQGELVASSLSAREADVAAADTSLASACALNIAVACELRGNLDVVREPAETYAKIALASFERGCALGAPRACCGAADMIEQSRGAKREPARSERLRTRAATLGTACGVAGSAARPRGVRSTETKLEAQGGLATDAVAVVVRASHPRLRDCYERGLARNPALRGAVTVSFAVDAAGDPAELRTTSSTLADDAVVACVEVVYHTLKFPLPAQGKATVVSGIEFGVE